MSRPSIDFEPAPETSLLISTKKHHSIKELTTDKTDKKESSHWQKLRLATAATKAFRSAHQQNLASPYKRSDSISRVACPWKQISSKNIQTDFDAPPPHAANCPCCVRTPFEIEAGDKCVVVKTKKPAATTDERRKAVLRRWHLPLLALRFKPLTPLKISNDAEMDQPLPQCPATLRGELPNGLSYFIRSCAKPAGRAVIRLVFRAGSLNEADDQLGMAHFVEHCAFLKLKSYGKGELVSFLESIGAQFGADLNAHTSFSETVYKLNVPIDGEKGFELLDKALGIAGEWASGVLIEEDLVTPERTVVNEEWRSRLGVGSRLFQQYLSTVWGHERLAKRLPIGGEGDAKGMKCVLNGDVQRLRDFYSHNYRPELCAIIAVGDFAHLEKGGKTILSLIEKHMGKWPRTPKERYAKALPFECTAPKQLPDAPTKTLICIDSELSGSAVEIGLVLAPAPWARTARTLLDSMQRDIWMEVLNFRLAKLVENGGADPPFAGAHGSREAFEGAPMFELSASLRTEDQWEGALSTILDEANRLLLYGATEAEVDRIVKNYESGLQARYRERHDVESAEIASELVTHFLHDGESVANMSLEYVTRLLLALLGKKNSYEDVPFIDASSVSAAGKASFSKLSSPTFLRVIAPRGGPKSEAALLKVLEDANERVASGKIKPPADEKPPSADALFAEAAACGALSPAKLVSKEPLVFSCASHESLQQYLSPVLEARDGYWMDPKLEAFHWTFDNGCTVTWARTPFEADTISISASALGGYGERKAVKEESDWWGAADAALNGIGELKNVDLSVALAGIAASGHASCGVGARSLSGGCTSNHLKEALHLMWASAKRARFDDSTLVRLVRNAKEMCAQRKADPGYHFEERVSALLNGKRSKAHTDAYGDTAFNREIAALEAPHAVATMAALRRAAVGEAGAGCWSFILVGALPPTSELQELLEATLGAFDAPPQYTINLEEPTSEMSPKYGGEDTEVAAADSGRPRPLVEGWLKAPKCFPRLPDEEEKEVARKAAWQNWLYGPRKGARYAKVRAGREDSSSTVILLPADPKPLKALSAASRVSVRNPADSAVRSIHYARSMAGAVAEVRLRKKLREELGLVYSVGCAYQSSGSTSVQFTCDPNKANKCVKEALKTLWAIADGEVEQSEIDAIVEQDKRSAEEGLIRNGYYEGILVSAVQSARTAPTWMREGEGVAHERASGADPKLIAEKVLLESKLNDAPPTLAAVKAAAVQIFPSDDRVVVTMVREYTWGEVGRRVLLAAAVVAVAAVAVKRRAR